MNQVLIQLIYFVIYSVVFLVIGKLSFSESDSLSKFFVGERKNDEKRLFFTSIISDFCLSMIAFASCGVLIPHIRLNVFILNGIL